MLIDLEANTEVSIKTTLSNAFSSYVTSPASYQYAVIDGGNKNVNVTVNFNLMPEMHGLAETK
jgi:hypothetical protein